MLATVFWRNDLKRIQYPGCTSSQHLRMKHLGTKWFSERDFHRHIFTIFIQMHLFGASSTVFSARLKIQHRCFRTCIAMQSLMATSCTLQIFSFTPCWARKAINRLVRTENVCPWLICSLDLFCGLKRINTLCFMCLIKVKSRCCGAAAYLALTYHPYIKRASKYNFM